MKAYFAGASVMAVATGKCNHPEKRIIPETVIKAGKSILEEQWTHCIHCTDEGYCMKRGDCEHKFPTSEERGKL